MTPWQPVYKQARAQRSVTLAFDIARRFGDPGIVERAVASARAGSREPHSIYWHPYALAQGDCGVALMFGYFDACFPDHGWDRVAHQWIERAAQGAANAGELPNGLFEGLSGLAFAVAFLSRQGLRYRNLLANLHEHVVEQTRIACDGFGARSGPAPFSAWDAIAGLTGAGVYLLTQGDHAALQPILECLVDLTHNSHGLPGWYTAPEASGAWMRHAFPDGHLNCGLAHGIPGPLALLALARLAGVTAPGSDEAIDRIANWLSSHRLTDSWGANWPSAVPLVRREDHLVPGACEGLSAAHAGWCYGSPGVARALWLAGRARENAAYAALSLESMRAVIRRPPDIRALTSPALCHGFAGLLCITLRFRHDNSDPMFTKFARELVRQIEAVHEPDTLLGYRTTEPGGGRIDQAGLLDGAPGVAMALLAAATDCAPTWDRLFLLS